jgi:hypothetical protein
MRTPPDACSSSGIHRGPVEFSGRYKPPRGMQLLVTRLLPTTLMQGVLSIFFHTRLTFRIFLRLIIIMLIMVALHHDL